MLQPSVVQQLKATLRASVANREIAGGNLLVMKEDEELFYHEDGMADLEAGLAIRRDTIFRIYSMTKPITAASVMSLMERGEIDLLEPVANYLPGFKHQTVDVGGTLVPVQREATIHDLLQMTSGLVYAGTNAAGRATEAWFQDIERSMSGDSPLGTVEAVNRLGELPLAFQPGSSWQYGTSADVLGAVVEVASGLRFGEFLRQRLFEPLGMADTGFWVPEEKRERLSKTYSIDSGGDLTLYTGNRLGVAHRMDRKPAYESGGAGLVSTIDDYAKFARMLLSRGRLNGNQVLQPKTVDYFTSGSLQPHQQKGFDRWHPLRGHSYGNLLRVMKDTSQAGFIGCRGEYGWDGWLGTYFCVCPEEKLTFLMMLQLKDAGTTPIVRKLRNLLSLALG